MNEDIQLGFLDYEGSGYNLDLDLLTIFVLFAFFIS